MERALGVALDPRALAASRRGRDEVVVLLDGAPEFPEAWPRLAALGARRRRHGPDPLDDLDRLVRARRAHGGGAGTGVAAILPYEPGGADTLVVEVDASVVVLPGESPRLEAVDRAGLEWARREIEAPAPLDLPRPPPPPAAPARTSLPREAYLAAVRRVKDHIARGDIYQANLTQRLTTSPAQNPFALYRALVEATPAPRAAFVESGSFALASASPETFVDVEADGRIATMPIKGTRPRAANPEADQRAAEELLRSAKDRAELVMIVDLERNDLGRVCRTGSVRVAELAELRSFPAVHHLVARVEGRLRPDTGPADLVRAVFPGGSITGAPKLRAIEILRDVEPVPRGAYTGSLFWFGDDGVTRSSILIRSIVVNGREASVGAGGGVVADSDPEAEWHESNAKARALTRALGFEPEDAR